MTPAQKYLYWVMLSDYDIETAEVLIKGERWPYVVMACELAVERLLKGMHIYHTGKEAPKSRNLSFLFNKIQKDDNFISHVDRKKVNSEIIQHVDFMMDLMYYHISDYPFSYKKIMQRFIDSKTAVDLYQRTLLTLAWLKSFQDISNVPPIEGI